MSARKFRPIASRAPRDEKIWAHGFTFTGDGLACDRCRALVPENPEAAQVHRDWHDDIDDPVEPDPDAE